MSEHEEDQDERPDLKPIKGHFTDLGLAKKKKPVWIIDGLVTSGLTIVIGPPKDSFKTTAVMAMLLLIARLKHTALPEEWTAKTKGPVLIFEAEADPGELREMVEDGIGVKVPADESIMVADRPEDYRLDDPDAVEQMMEWIRERDPAAVMLDPLVNFHELDEKESTAMVRILSPLRREAKDRDIGFFIIHHTRKIEDGKTYTANDARGTSAIFGLCDNILTFTPGKEPYEILVDRRGKKGKAFQKVFKLGIWERKGMSTKPPMRAVEKLIVNAIMHGFNTLAAIAAHLNMPMKTLAGPMSHLVKNKTVAMGQVKGPMGALAMYKLHPTFNKDDLR